MSEHSMRSLVLKAMKAQHAVPVENPALPGTPDVQYIGGWIELKQITEWPKRESTFVIIDHYTSEQRIFHIRRRLAGGTCWVLLQCRRDWLLFDAAVAALNLNSSTRSELFALAEHISKQGLNQELINCILQTQSAFCWTVDAVAKINKLLQSDSRLRSTDT